MKYTLLLTALLVLLCGCTAPSLDPPGVAAATPRSEALAGSFWGNSGHLFQGRYSAVLEWDGQLVTFQGVLMIDTRQRQARLVALSDLGARLFDISLTPEQTSVHTSLPHFGISRMRERGASAVRRMLLGYLPGVHDGVTLDAQTLLSRCSHDVCLRSGFDPDTGVLLGKEYRARQPLWRATFADYRQTGGFQVPGRLEYADICRGDRLTMEWNPQRKMVNHESITH